MMRTPLVLLLLVGCAGSYEQATRRWTRSDSSHRSGDTTIEIHATLKSPPWRAAFVDETARRERMNAADRQALAAAQKAEAQTYWDVQLIVATHDYAPMDFSSNDKSMWRMRLVGDEGREVAPISVRSDDRTRPVIASWFPMLSPFHRSYLMRFPATAADGAPLVAPGGKLRLRIGSSIGTVEVAWAL